VLLYIFIVVFIIFELIIVFVSDGIFAQIHYFGIYVFELFYFILTVEWFDNDKRTLYNMTL